LRQLRHM